MKIPSFSLLINLYKPEILLFKKLPINLLSSSHSTIPKLFFLWVNRIFNCYEEEKKDYRKWEGINNKKEIKRKLWIINENKIDFCHLIKKEDIYTIKIIF